MTPISPNVGPDVCTAICRGGYRLLLRRALWLLALLPLVVVAAPEYKSAAEIPVADFFRLARYSQMAMSPDGKTLAALAPFKGRDNLVVLDLEQRSSRALTILDYVDVADFLWLDDSRLFFRTVDQQLENGQTQVYRGYFAIDVDTANTRNLHLERQFPRILGAARDGSGDLIVARRSDRRASEEVVRLNTRTGRSRTLTFRNPGDVVAWAIDGKGAVRAALRHDPRESPDRARTYTLWYRDDAEGEWRSLGTPSEDPQGLRPVAFDHDDALIVAARAGNDRAALYRYDVAQRRLGEKLYSHPWLDVSGGLIQHPRTRRPLGVKFSAEKPQTHWFDPALADLQAAMDKALPDTVNELSPGDDNARVLVVFAQSATDAGTYYLYDQDKRSLEKVAATRDWLPPALMAERRFVAYKARDGLTIPAWLTLPRGVDPKNLPLVVHIHGGPWVRSFHGVQWGRWPAAQFFASRGYAVLEPEPRGSAGFGTRHYTASMKQWGLAMQDDITDGALQLVREGIVDKSRMCLFGGSYGGYASLQGLVKDPELWRCASSYIAVTDLELLQTVSWSDTAQQSDYLDTDFKRRVGDYQKDRAQFDETSPARNAQKIKAAVMLTMGGNDKRVPLIHGTTMRDAMEKAGKPLDYHVYVDESHGFTAPDNVTDFYARTERFFARHLK